MHCQSKTCMRVIFIQKIQERSGDLTRTLWYRYVSLVNTDFSMIVV